MNLKRLLTIAIFASTIAACSSTKEPVKPPVQEVVTINEISYYNSIWFAHDSTAVASDFDSIISLNANYLNSNPLAQVQIQGNASEDGTREHNLKLAQARAKSVAVKLIALGVKPSQIQQVSFGSGKPTFPNDQKGHSPKNRRVDIIYISGAPTPYFIELLPVVTTEDETVEFDPVSIKEQKQRQKVTTHNNSSNPQVSITEPTATPTMDTMDTAPDTTAKSTTAPAADEAAPTPDSSLGALPTN